MKKLIANRPVRRVIGASCLIAGALLMWLAPDAVAVGVVLFATGIALEIAGIALEHCDSG
jgi:hypothetical protein